MDGGGEGPLTTKDNHFYNTTYKISTYLYLNVSYVRKTKTEKKGGGSYK